MNRPLPFTCLPALALMLTATHALADAPSATPPPPPGLAITEAARTGNGEWLYQSVPGWAQLPAGETWRPTHGSIVTDKAGNVYASTDGPSGILVFKPDGSFVRSIKGAACGVNLDGNQHWEGIHGMLIREEEADGKKTEYLYAAHLGGKQVLKLRADTGEVVMTILAPKAEYGGNEHGLELHSAWPWRPTAPSSSPTATATRASTSSTRTANTCSVSPARARRTASA